jgi:hypothetical protein
MKKVYCEDCKYLKLFMLNYLCDHPDNLKDSYLKPKNYYIKDPSERNKKNKCKWFVEK